MISSVPIPNTPPGWIYALQSFLKGPIYYRLQIPFLSTFLLSWRVHLVVHVYVSFVNVDRGRVSSHVNLRRKWTQPLTGIYSGLPFRPRPYNTPFNGTIPPSKVLVPVRRIRSSVSYLSEYPTQFCELSVTNSVVKFCTSFFIPLSRP